MKKQSSSAAMPLLATSVLVILLAVAYFMVLAVADFMGFVFTLLTAFLAIKSYARLQGIKVLSHQNFIQLRRITGIVFGLVTALVIVINLTLTGLTITQRVVYIAIDILVYGSLFYFLHHVYKK